MAMKEKDTFLEIKKKLTGDVKKDILPLLQLLLNDFLHRLEYRLRIRMRHLMKRRFADPAILPQKTGRRIAARFHHFPVTEKDHFIHMEMDARDHIIQGFPVEKFNIDDHRGILLLKHSDTDKSSFIVAHFCFHCKEE